MKHLYYVAFALLWPSFANAQSFVNPDTIYQKGDIILQNTDVYYKPFAPPGPLDTRQNLCNESTIYNDPNGVGNGSYSPMIYEAAVHGFVTLSNWSPPCDSGNVLGPNVCWQRLFQAMNKPDGTPSDIVAGGGAPGTRVTVSANEDVDFRASGRIKLKSGFHVKPGAFFHAYTEPKWDTAVFSDEFSDSAAFHNHWYIANGHAGGSSGTEPDCGEDSNVRIVHDSDAHDGWALDLILREDTDTCNCTVMKYSDTSSCQNVPDPSSSPYKDFYSSAYLRSCPFPYASTDSLLGRPAYAHTPYGKYEFRDKIPHVLHHTNNWGSSWDMEYDLNETNNATMGRVCPENSKQFRYGPFHGHFVNDTMFVSTDAGWNWQTQATGIIVNNFLYLVSNTNATGHIYATDTVVAASETKLQSGFPSSLAASGATLAFYAEENDWHYADTVTWTVIKGSDNKWDMFSGYYKIHPGDSLFSKTYQPVQLKLTTSGPPHTATKTLTCHWVDTANDPYNHGKIYLDQPLDSSTDLLTNTEAYQYQVVDIYAGANYPFPPVIIGADTITPDTGSDTTAFATSPYRYHTFAMEFLPHEIRYLIDSVVVRRIPDRLIPRSSPYYDYASTEPRSPTVLFPAQFDIDVESGDPFRNLGGDDGTLERKFLEHALATPGWPGCWPVEIPEGSGHWYPAAHHMLDYVKVWDVPKDVKIPAFPQ